MITFIADKVKINGPRIDGSYSITFETGEYTWDQIKDLPNLNGDAMMVSISKYDETRPRASEGNGD